MRLVLRIDGRRAARSAELRNDRAWVGTRWNGVRSGVRRHGMESPLGELADIALRVDGCTVVPDRTAEAAQRYAPIPTWKHSGTGRGCYNKSSVSPNPWIFVVLDDWLFPGYERRPSKARQIEELTQMLLHGIAHRD